LPHRSTLSRFLAALDQPTVEALRTLFQKDLLARSPFPSLGGLFDRTGGQWMVIDVDGTRATARQRALPQTDALPVPHRRFDQVCAPGYTGRKRGEVVRTRTVVLQAHTHQFLGTFGAPGNGDYRGDLCRAPQVSTSYVTALGVPSASVLLRLDGLYGDAAPCSMCSRRACP
jgi:FPC/CPF motif-containing protein YcgG